MGHAVEQNKAARLVLKLIWKVVGVLPSRAQFCKL
jgi:hypothetical protein